MTDLEEARAILAGTTALLPTMKHLEALADWHEVTLIRIANQVEVLEQSILNQE